MWIPTAKLRDWRALMRTRLALVAQRTTIKNRIAAAVNRHGLRDDSCGDLFIGKGRLRLDVYIAGMPVETREAALEEWVVVDELREHIENPEERIAQHIGRIGHVRLLKTMPGVGEILGATIWLEVGDVERFPSAPLWPALPAWCRRCMPAGARCIWGRPRGSPTTISAGLLWKRRARLWRCNSDTVRLTRCCNTGG